VRIIFVLIALSALSATGVAQQNNLSVIDKFISAQAAKEKGVEPEGIRKAVTGDLNHDGVADTAVVYTIEGQNGSNNYIQYLAVFLGTRHGLVHAAHQPIGGKNHREVELVSIEDGQIKLNTVDYGPKDPSCCPTIKGTTSYSLVGRQLKEKRIRKT
jgi:hypothetical protein